MRLGNIVGLLALSGMWSCGGEETATEQGPASKNTETKPAAEAPVNLPPVQEGLFSSEDLYSYGGATPVITWYVEGGDLGGSPTLMLSQAHFTKVNGKTTPKPATMVLLTEADGKWTGTEVTDDEAAVFHKAVIRDGSVYAITGGDPSKSEQQATFKRWKMDDTGSLGRPELIWQNKWSGKNQRLRDFEIGDVDGDGQDEVVVATHDQGVIVVLEGVLNDDPVTATELDEKAETFVHEIELGDVDKDGVPEFFATPSDPNKKDWTQAGDVVMYTHADGTYTRHLVDHTETTHAKEIFVTDMNGDGVAEVFSAVEAQKEDGKLVSDVEIRQFQFDGIKATGHKVIATFPGGEQLRFMMAHDFDGDGRKELIVAPMKTGLYYLSSQDGQTYSSQRFFENSGGFEHAANLIDLDQDGTPELYVADDNNKKLRRFTWNGQK